MKSILVVLLLIPLVCAGQFDVELLKDTNSYNGSEYGFALIKTNSESARRINEYLQISVLGLLIGKEESSIFENVWPTEEDHFKGWAFYQTTVTLNTENLLVLQVSSEGCAAYCESGDSYLIFDARSGNRIELDDLFSEVGFDLLKQKVNLERKLQLTNEIIRTYGWDSQTKKEMLRENRSEYKESMKEGLEINEVERSIYVDCLAGIEKYSFQKSFYLDSTNIYLIRERCSNHANRGIDNVGEFRNALGIRAIDGLLSDYGRKVLLGERIDATVTTITGIVYDGLVDAKYSIKLVLNYVEGKYASGKYLYTTRGKGIELSGINRNGIFEIEERNDDGAITGKLNFTFSDGNQAATGTWTSPDGKSLKLELFRE
ncbi:MAG: hypothetical protein RIG68_14515 [Imperialibacter sp.]|uniref:hypothetical protein n=1 Tax=Imperialibacter sp. TaxID=2038411 RepID=UPI0032EEED88